MHLYVYNDTKTQITGIPIVIGASPGSNPYFTAPKKNAIASIIYIHIGAM